MAAVVKRTFSSSSTTSRRLRRAGGRPRPFGVAVVSLRARDIVLRERRRIDGQDDVEGRALPLGAGDLDAAAVVADDVLRHPEAEPRPLRAGREEGLEDARQL